MVHLVSSARCYNKLLILVHPFQNPASLLALNSSDVVNYFLNPNSRLLSLIASEAHCSSLFPATYQTHQGWMSVTPNIHHAPAPEPLPVQLPQCTKDVFKSKNYNKDGLYRSSTLLECKTSCLPLFSGKLSLASWCTGSTTCNWKTNTPGGPRMSFLRC